MSLLGTGLLFSKTTWTQPVTNAAPAISSVSLNFDFRTNVPPTGGDLGFGFKVTPSNAAPSIAAVSLNFDLVINSAPAGQHMLLTYPVSGS